MDAGFLSWMVVVLTWCPLAYHSLFSTQPAQELFIGSRQILFFKPLWWLSISLRVEPKALSAASRSEGLSPDSLPDFGSCYTASHMLCFSLLACLGALRTVPQIHARPLHLLLPLQCSLMRMISFLSFRSLLTCHLPERPPLITLFKLIAPHDMF